VVSLTDALEQIGDHGAPLAVISAGWQEGEDDLTELAAAAGRPVLGLELYRRAANLLGADARLHAAYRNRQDRLIVLQQLYRLRLKHLSLAARRLLESDQDAALLVPEQRHAIAQLRALDRHHLHRTEMIQLEFDSEFDHQTHPALAEQAAEIESILRQCSGVLIAGGNVLVLLNRIRLFGLEDSLRNRPIVAWSAGAMVLSERIVLYHDRAPQGRRDSEIMGSGLGLLPGHVFLPDARRRLRAQDRNRVALFCRRYSPDTCLTLDSGTQVRFDGATRTAARGAYRLTAAGDLEAADGS
jgi:hypothetical protein